MKNAIIVFAFVLLGCTLFSSNANGQCVSFQQPVIFSNGFQSFVIEQRPLLFVPQTQIIELRSDVSVLESGSYSGFFGFSNPSAFELDRLQRLNSFQQSRGIDPRQLLNARRQVINDNSPTNVNILSRVGDDNSRGDRGFGSLLRRRQR
jgi:hypothetical protein